MLKKIWLLALLIPGIAFQVRAQNDQFQFSHLDIKTGLSHNQVTSIFKDSQGFMWFGTLSGLNKYDGTKITVFKQIVGDSSTLNDDFIVNILPGPDRKLWVQTRNGYNIYNPDTDKFSHDINQYLKSIAIPNDSILTIKKDNSGNYWFLHASQGLYKYNPLSHKTIHISHKEHDSGSVFSNLASDLNFDSTGNIWLVYNDGIIEEMNPSSYRIVFRFNKIGRVPSGEHLNYKLLVDKQNDLWAYVPTYSSGVYYLSSNHKIFKHLDKGIGKAGLNTNVISDVIQDEKNRIWIATDHGGINLLEKQLFTIRYLLNREDDDKSLSQNSIISLYKDNTGIVWVGTYRTGISYYHESIIKFPLYTHHLSDPQSLPFSDINKFVEDKSGNLWLGTNGGGLIYFDRQKSKFTTYLHSTTDKNSLSNNVIVSMAIDHEQKLWIGTYFGGLDCFNGTVFTHFKHDDTDAGSISEDRIWSIIEDSENRLWVGTLAGGLNLFNRATRKFSHYKFGPENTIHSNYISALLEDRHKNLWIVTSYGVDVLIKKTGKFIHYIHDPKDRYSLVNNNTNDILEDSAGLIWISTREGLSIFDPSTGKFQNLVKEDGLPDNAILEIQEDERHNIWVSTPNGLSNLQFKRGRGKLNINFINYSEADGLQGREFTENASGKTHRGELIFGGGHGFNIFKPGTISTGKILPILVFTDFQLFNKSIKAGDVFGRRVILKKAIAETSSLTLHSNENVFSVEFAGLNYFNPEKSGYQYKLEGFDQNFIPFDLKTRKVTYTNLDAGTYRFIVRSPENSLRKEQQISLIIHILPPVWRTPLAYALYLFSIIGILFLIRRRGIRNLHRQFDIEKERNGAQQMHELDLMKIKFFTNVSHEFRTPLSLILAPIDKLLTLAPDSEASGQLVMVKRNAKRLLNLVNQLMDFRKMEYQELRLHKTCGELVSFIKEIASSFHDIGEKKDIAFLFDSDTDSIYALFDHDKIERILFNLLSNAYKFTLSGGQVTVLLELKPMNEINLPELEIRIIDTGIGIAADSSDKIFEPFFQHELPGSMLNQGSGIGLSITKEFVKILGGTVTVTSEVGQGSCFTIILPLELIDPELVDDILEDFEEPVLSFLPAFQGVTDGIKINAGNKKSIVLLVEDNYDLRQYIKENLLEEFAIIEASNGKEGWQKVLSGHPDIIVSDINMPEMTGIELCQKLKKDPRTLHIPVILLTAMIGEEEQLKGLETGATDYITKPFNFLILQSKLKNILAEQLIMRKTYTKRVDANPIEQVIDSPDALFIKKLLSLIEANLTNPNFSIEELSGEMYMSRYTLYKKILALTGKTPIEFVRSMRMKKAAKLIETGHYTISQVCHKVGFKNQKYFVRSFKLEFNVLPSKYLESIAG